MLAEQIEQMNARLRLSHYRQLFAVISEKSGSLTATEAFSAEVAYLLDKPTIKQFADFIGISLPNAAYKIAALVEKGYVVKTVSETDRRESIICMTDKFRRYYDSSADYIAETARLIEERLSKKEQTTLIRLLEKINQKEAE